MPMKKKCLYIVAGSKRWNRRIFKEHQYKLPGNWQFCANPDQLNAELKQESVPKYIFFLHWQWKIPADIISKCECVCFHMTDVPYGRGGSPLQNLIVHNHRWTKLTALRMVEDFDAGPVYLREDLCIEGNAEEIYLRATYLSFQMINKIIDQAIKPTPQVGKETVFKRRAPEQSRIGLVYDLLSLYDFIRMLDADGYPKAFFEKNGFRYEFTHAGYYDERIIADVTITPIERKSK